MDSAVHGRAGPSGGGETNRNAATPPPFSLREMLTILFKDRHRILAAFGVCFAITLIAVLLAKPEYMSDASLLVRLGREYIYTADTGNGSSMALPYAQSDAMRAEAEIIASRDLIRAAIEKVGLGRLYPELAEQREDPRRPKLEQAVEAFRGKLDAQLMKNATVLEVGYRHTDPVLAQAGLQALVEVYLDRRRGIFADSHVGFLDEQVAIYEQRLQEAEQRLAKFKQKHGIIQYDQQISLLLQQGNELENRLNEAQQQLTTANARAKALRQLARKTPANLVQYSEANADVQTPRQLLELQLKEQSLRSRYVDDNPLVLGAQHDVAVARNFLLEQKRDPPTTVRTGRNLVRDAAETDLLRAESDESAYRGGSQALQQRLEQLRRQASELARQQIELDALTRRQKLVADTYETYARKLEEARIAEARSQQERTSVSVVQAADLPLKRKSLRLPILAIGFFLSLAAALLVAFVSEALRSHFLSPEKLERELGVPVLASMPVVER